LTIIQSYLLTRAKQWTSMAEVYQMIAPCYKCNNFTPHSIWTSRPFQKS